MNTKSDAKKIVETIEAAIRATMIADPEAARMAAEQIAEVGFCDTEERATVSAFVRLMRYRADRKERLLREAFSTKTEPTS